MAKRIKESVTAYHAAPPRAAAVIREGATPTSNAAGSTSAIVGVAAPGMRAKLFANGRSQAVRLPKEFRLPGVEVLIHREGDRVILEAVPNVPRDANGWPVDLWEWLDQFSDDFADPEPLPVGFLAPEAIPTFDPPARKPTRPGRRAAPKPSTP